MAHLTNLEAVNALCVSSGGSGGHLSMLPALNELCALQGVTAGHLENLSALNAIDTGLGGDGDHLTNLDALNSISLLIGGTGGYTSVLPAWQEIESIGFDQPYDPEGDPDFFAHLQGLIGSENPADPDYGVYYMEDIVGTNNCKLVNSLCNTFAFVNGSGGDSYVQFQSRASTINLSSTVVTTYKLKMKLDNLTQAVDATHLNKVISNGGTTNFGKGFFVFHDYVDSTCIFKVQISNGTRYMQKSFTTALDTDWHLYEFSWNPTTMIFTITIDGEAESVAWTAPFTTDSNRLYEHTSQFLLGNNNGCGYFTCAYFDVYRDGSRVFNVPFQVNSSIANQVYDRIAGGYYDIRKTTLAYQDVFPGNVLNGYDLYTYLTVTYYVPLLTTGESISSVNLSGYAKIATYPAGDYLNNCETDVEINGTDYTYTELTSYPFSKNFSKFTALKITDIIAHTATATPATREKIFEYLGFTIFNMSGFIGDSIMAGIAADYDLLAAGYDDSITAEKVWEIKLQQWQDVTIYNSKQPILQTAVMTGTITSNTSSATVTGSGTAFLTDLQVGNLVMKNDAGITVIGRVQSIESNTSLTLMANAVSTNAGIAWRKDTYPRSFCPLLGMAKNRNNGRNAEYAVGGTLLSGNWLTTENLNVLWKSNMLAAFRAAMELDFYPHWTGMYVCLGTNDAETEAKRDAIATNAAALINDLRTFSGEDMPFHWLLPRSNDADRIIVRNLLLAMTTDDLYFYESDDLTYADSVHPDHAGTIAIGEMFYLENFL